MSILVFRMADSTANTTHSDEDEVIQTSEGGPYGFTNSFNAELFQNLPLVIRQYIGPKRFRPPALTVISRMVASGMKINT